MKKCFASIKVNVLPSMRWVQDTGQPVRFLTSASLHSFLVDKQPSNPKKTLTQTNSYSQNTYWYNLLFSLGFNSSLFFNSGILLSIVQQEQELKLLKVSQKTQTGVENQIYAFIYPSPPFTYREISCSRNARLFVSIRELRFVSLIPHCIRCLD